MHKLTTKKKPAAYNPSLRKHRLGQFRLKHPHISQRTQIGFLALFTIVLINLVIMTIYYYDADYEYRLMSHSYIEAVLPNQAASQTLQTGIVRVIDVDPDVIVPGERVIIYDSDSKLLPLENNRFPLVATVVSVDLATQTVQVSYDNIFVQRASVSDLLGSYVHQASFVGTYYYTSMFTFGYIMLATGHVILLGGYYFVFIYDVPTRFAPAHIPRKKIAERPS